METEKEHGVGVTCKPVTCASPYSSLLQKAQGILEAFAFLHVLLSFSLLCLFIFFLFLWDFLSHDNMTKENAFYSRFNQSSLCFYLVLNTHTDRAQRGFVGLNYFPKIDWALWPPRQQASPQQLFQMDELYPRLQSTLKTSCLGGRSGFPYISRHASPFPPPGDFSIRAPFRPPIPSSPRPPLQRRGN